MGGALNTIGGSFAGQRTPAHFPLTWSPVPPRMRECISSLKPVFPANFAWDRQAPGFPSFYPEWDNALPPCSSAGLPSVPLLDLNAGFDWRSTTELGSGIDHAISSRDYSITHTPMEGNGGT